MINQAQKIDSRVFVGEKYFRFFRNRLFQQNHNCHSNYAVKQSKILRILFARLDSSNEREANAASRMVEPTGIEPATS